MVTILITHIAFAVACIPLMLSATVVKYFGNIKIAQSLAKYSSYSLIGLLSTGTILVIAFHAGLVNTCYAGLVYTAFFGISFVAYRKLATSKIYKD
jgi:hypothetical protein